MDKLRNLKFNPFDASNNIALSENNANIDNHSNINCEYYLPNDFKQQINQENLSNNFSIIHLNIRSIVNKFESFKQLTAVGKNIIVGVIYRPPNSKFDLFENKMNQILGKIDQENKICYLMGDFNIDLLKSESI
jgi:hypothetical protein